MIVLVMGVSASGKTTIARALADRLGVAFEDADDFHPPANRAKMAADIPLSDDDRRPWLEAIASQMPTWEAAGGAVLACSALKAAYRDVLFASGVDHRVVFLELAPEAAAERLEPRRGTHPIIRDFRRVLEGQYRDLEPPRDAIVVPATLPVQEIVARVVGALRPGAAHTA